MKRAIKFRLITDKKIVGYERFDHGEWYYSRDGIQWNEHFILHDDKDQYTGRKDHHEAEIYEGDILNDYETKKAHLGRTYVVSWVDDGWFVCIGKFHYRLKDAVHQEVIGNPYEHPELLQRDSL